MKAITSGALIALLGMSCAAAESVTHDPLAPLDAPSPPAPAPVKPVTETLWRKQVTDNYRYMEALDPQTIAWMKAQSAHTRSILDAIPTRAALEAKIAAFTGSFGFTRGYVSYGGRAFYEERTPGSDNFDLVVRDKTGKRKIVDVTALSASNGGTPHAINYFLASPDGSKVAAGISQGGSEAASIFVYDTATGKQIAGPLDRADPGFTTWSNDSSTLYFARLKKLAPGEADIEKYRNPTFVSWDLKSEPVAVLGSTVGHGPSFLPDELPTLSISPGAPMAMAVSINGVQNELALWLAPVSQVNDPNVKWTPFVTRADDVTAADAAGDTIYLLSHKNAPTFQVLSVNAGQPLAAARVLVPAEKDRVLDAIHAASDALYVLARHGAYSLLLRVPYAAGKIEEVALPFKGLIREAFADPRQPGITIDLQGFVVPPTTFAYDPEKKKFTDLELGVTPHYNSGRYEISDLEARAEDGVMVPNTLVRPKGAKGPQIVLIQAYGSYGISQLANFSLRTVSFLEAGGTYASCHVRGGGELGDAWRLAGKDANKPNTWRDLIACAEDLIARGHTTKDKLFIFGGSAGGITMGRALTERPDLFAGVIAIVPGANTLRSEFQPSGPLNIPEFGTIKTEEGFKNLYEMDTIQHVRPGVQYPPVLITTGLNDPRVSSWEPAKLTAALQASGTARPILLRIDAEAGHGIGNTKSQDDALYADMWAFVFWRAGLPDWQPHFSKR
ncbi:MAG TPA: prolyl oligopeptidase family serine peptidase [Mesorhizobium sp.]|nr:prolyl oligopeptidase family serine peptidase [Mesorhizobium sp.]